MDQGLFSIEEIKQEIISGKNLLLAGDEQLLRQLPKGSWIGGTIPYFMGKNGGEQSTQKVFATQLPDYVSSCSIKVYNPNTLENIYQEMPENGFSVIILPFESKTHLAFSLNAPGYPGFATRPLIGWIAGVGLDDVGKVNPKVYNGSVAESYSDAAVVMHVTLPQNKIAELGIINIFDQSDADVFTFPEDGFTARDVFVNGKKQNFAEYLTGKQIGTQLPLVANYSGALINTSFQSIDTENKQVHFYAPVFHGFEYRLASPVENYTETFTAKLPKNLPGQMAFSCNCILNYLYSGLEGKKTGAILGPITFGEIAYQLLNQTLVYLTILDL